MSTVWPGSTHADARVPTDRRVVEALRRDIYGGALPAGFPLREVALAERFRVGRYTIRSALARLAADGLVEQIPNVGVRVRRLSLSDVEDIYRVRRTLEFAALDAVIKGHLSLDGSRRSAERVERFERSDVSRRNIRRLALDADLGFHRSVVEAARSPRLLRAYSTLLGELRLALTQLIPTAQVVPGEHWELLRALEDDDLAHARRWVTRHLDQGVADIARALALQSP